MDKKALWKWLLLVVLVGGSLYTVLPFREKVRLGLDLKGGTSFTVQIDEEAVAAQLREEAKEASEATIQARLPTRLKEAQERALEVIRNRVDGLGIAEPVIYPEKGNRIVVQLPGVDEKKREEAARAIQSAAFLEFRLVHEKNAELVAKLFERGLAPEGFTIVSLEHMGRRREYYKRDRNAVPDEKMDAEFRAKLATFQAPHGYEFMLERERIGRQEVYTPYFVEKRRQLSGDMLKDAGMEFRSATMEPVVRLEFNATGARKFASVTSDYAPGGARNPNPQMGRMLAIILDGTLYSAPVIREPIHGGRAEISGSFTQSEAMFLANILRAGSLPAPVKIVERRVVDPTLGTDSIRSGVRAGLLACVIVAVLMAGYYLFSGLVADFALLLNVILLPLGMILVAGFLGMFTREARQGGAIALPVLTLPGIAGIALSIGMAVDANVLIFERMREEMRTGKGLVATITAGFQRAFTAIFDSNVTTIITAVILFLLGSGPVRGYALTLIAGLLVNLYSAVVVSRMCFNAIAARTAKMSVLKMLSAIKPTNFDFIRPWKLALLVSLVVIGVSWAVMINRGRMNPGAVFGVDFTGGSALTLGFEQKQDLEPIRAALAAAGVKEAGLQYQKEMESTHEVLQIKVGSIEEGRKVAEILPAKFPAAGFKVLQQDDVGPQVGADLKRRAVMAMSLALVALILYIWFRFQIGFGVGAVAALFHDVLVTAGVCHLLGIQITMTVVAALMTIIGYSVNDTIVIFDRIRENLRLVRGKSFVEICNQSLNETLARTLLTNFLTFVSVMCLVLLGGGAIRDFSVAMLIGMISGTYSTIYIATPVVLMWYRFRTPELGARLIK